MCYTNESNYPQSNCPLKEFEMSLKGLWFHPRQIVVDEIEKL